MITITEAAGRDREYWHSQHQIGGESRLPMPADAVILAFDFDRTGRLRVLARHKDNRFGHQEPVWRTFRTEPADMPIEHGWTTVGAEDRTMWLDGYLVARRTGPMRLMEMDAAEQLHPIAA